MNDHDMIIIGGGPAGLTAAIYACRAQLRVLMIERLMPGGQVAATDWVENYPGFEKGVAGADLMQKMETQAKRFGLEIISENVESLRFDQNIKKIITSQQGYQAKTVIISTGADPKLLDVPGEKELKGRGVSYCATCDGPFFKDKEIVVVGGGSSGIQESLYLTRFVKKIHLVEFLDQLTAEPILQARVENHDQFQFYLKHEVVSINGDQKVSSVTIRDRDSGKDKEIGVDGIFIWVGMLPNTSFLESHVRLNKWGYIVTNEEMETSVPGVYAAGDVRDKHVRQITTAVGDGTVAVESALKYLEQQD
jgi:thioredoxin reductase (NADPH)